MKEKQMSIHLRCPWCEGSETLADVILMLPLLFTHITVMEIKELRQDSEIFRKFVMESLLVPE